MPWLGAGITLNEMLALTIIGLMARVTESVLGKIERLMAAVLIHSGNTLNRCSSGRRYGTPPTRR